MARGDPAAALAELEPCAAREGSWGAATVTPVAWRSESAMACLALGRLAEARRLADEELALARTFGAPRAIGVALRAGGLAVAGESKVQSLELLREAATTLELSGDRLERARTAIALGSALRRAGHRAESRERLTEGSRWLAAAARRCSSSAPTPSSPRGGARRRKILRSGSRS